jgi:hypothetical protein
MTPFDPAPDAAEPQPDTPGDPRNLEAKLAAERAAEAEGIAKAIAALVAEFNEKYMVVNEAGKAIIYAPRTDTVLNRRFHDRMTFGSLRELYLNRLIKAGIDKDGSPILRPVADVWLKHRKRRQHVNGVVFDPSGREPEDGVLNLWQGFTVKPAPGDWSLLRQHVGKIICGGDLAHFNYLMGWMARLVQHPAEQGEVAVVLKGIEGCGKGILARAIKHILGQHGLAISNAKHLTGNFNAHLRDCVFLFVDEAFYAGDKQHVGVLKAIITEPYLTVEGKYQNAVQSPNFLHVMMASNEEWVVPASLESRRFFVRDVLPDRANDHPYFHAIQRQLEAGGYAAMLHDLIEYDLTHFNVRAVPVTDALQTQRKLSLGTSEAWWSDVLHRGYVFRSKLGLEEFFGKWHDEVTTNVLFDSYSEFAKGRNERRPMSREACGKFLTSMGAAACRPRHAVVGERIADVATAPHGHTIHKAELVREARAHAYKLGTLAQAREAFAKATGLVVEWEPEDDKAD